MFERIRRRLTLGYVGIFALILVIIGVVVVVSFGRQVAAEQDELLKQKARGTFDYVVHRPLERYQQGLDPEAKPPFSKSGDPPPIGPIQSSTETDLGVVALVPPEDANGEGAILDSSPSSSSFGLPFKEPARRAAQEGEITTDTVDGPEGERLRVVSASVTASEGTVIVIQATQSRRVVWETVRSLILVLIPVGLGGLLLAGMGGLYMSRRAMQPVRDSFERQRTFIADASHELKTPLALVKINAEVMKRDPADPDNREIIEDQLSEIDRMNVLLSDLLTLARLDAGRLDVEDKPFDLSVVTAETAGRFLMRAASEGIRLEIEAPDELPAFGDPERAAQILAALLDNAMRYTPKGGSVTVSGRLLDGRAETRVRDTGPGIAGAHLARIFDRFYRAEEARTRAGGGTGLGLSIARDLARAQSGDLSADNSPDGGASFTLRLPAGP